MGNHVGNAQCVPFGTGYFVLLFPKMCQLSLAVNVLDDQGGPGGTRPPPHAQGGVGVLDDQGGTVGTRQVAHAQGGTVGLGHVAGGRAGRQAVHAQVADDQGAPVGLGHVAGGLAVHVEVVNAHGVTVELDRHETAHAPARQCRGLYKSNFDKKSPGMVCLMVVNKYLSIERMTTIFSVQHKVS